MNTFKIVVTTVLTTLAVLTLGIVFATSLGAPVAEAHGFAAGGHGFGHRSTLAGGPCSHISTNDARFAEAYLSISLDLDDSQEQALTPLLEVIDRWQAEAGETCENLSIATLEDGLDTLESVLNLSVEAMRDLKPAFNDFYAQLHPDQQAQLDAWADHHHAE